MSFRTRPAASKAKTRQPAAATKPDLTPMIDCVFLLLIFFMCSMQFQKTEALIESFLPKDRGLGEAPAAIDLREVTVRISGTGEPADPVVLSLAKRVYSQVAGEPDYQELRADLQRLHHTALASGGEKFPVKIAARPEVPFKHVVRVLDICLAVGLEDVTFAAPGR